MRTAKTITLYARLGHPDFLHVKIDFDNRGRAKPVSGAASYFAMWRENGKRKTRHLGNDLGAAVDKYHSMQDQLDSGLAPRQAVQAVVVHANGSLPKFDEIEEALNAWMENLRERVDRGERRRKTLSDYGRLRQLLGNYCQEARVKTLGQIVADPQIMVRFKDYLHKHIEFRESHRRDYGMSNKLAYANTFFRFVGIKLFKDRNPRADDPGLLPRDEYVQPPDPEDIDRPVKFFEDDDIKMMRSVADTPPFYGRHADPKEEADFIEFALQTGFRDQEIAHAEWADIDFVGAKMRKKPSDPKVPSIEVREKPRSFYLPEGFKPKTKASSRRVPIFSLVDILKARQKRLQEAGVKSTLIFPNTQGKPDKHLERILERIVRKAEKRKHKFIEKPTLHSFRRTYATKLLDAGLNTRIIQRRLAHTTLEMTEKYLGINSKGVSEVEAGAFN
jgi:integrase